LAGREFQLLVLAVPETQAQFSRKPIATFAADFICPVILVGPEEADQFTVNSQAALMIDKLGIPAGKWDQIEAGLAR
jgi:hypothetical protein